MAWHDHRGFVDPKNTCLINTDSDNNFEFIINSKDEDLLINYISIDILDDKDSETVIKIRNDAEDFQIFTSYTVAANEHANEEDFIPTVHNKVIRNIYLRKGQDLIIGSNNRNIKVIYSGAKE